MDSCRLLQTSRSDLCYQPKHFGMNITRMGVEEYLQYARRFLISLLSSQDSQDLDLAALWGLTHR